ncbi:MAG: outer membrane beta-barrel protein [Dysgonamonadaceae bacterium]|jgi:hypothetical protein|nr:outer membrane beta-barrel protein [Dysgonamonadaceae bacterium]
MKKAVLFLFGIALFASLQAQNAAHSLWYGFSASYGKTLADVSGGQSLDFNNPYYADARLTIGYNLTPAFSLGIGAGIAGYHSPVVNVIPLFADVRYSFSKSLFAYADAGPALSNGGTGNATSKFFTDFGLGYKIKLGKNLSLTPSIGYNLLSYDMDWGDVSATDHRLRHSLYFRIGLQLF